MSTALRAERVGLANENEEAELGGRVEQVPIHAPLAQIREVFDRDGVVCLTDVVEPETIAGLRTAFDSLMASTDMEHFIDEETKQTLGVLTKRRSEILARAPDVIDRIVAQPRMLEFIESYLTQHCTSVLLHQIMALEIHPGEVAQPLHRDNMLWPDPGRRIPMGVALHVPLHDFTPETGATRVVLGSHRWPEALDYDPELEGGWSRYYSPERAREPGAETVVEAPLGSCVIFDGALVHGGGANTSQERVRQSLLVGYCLGWLRGETNQQLMWPPEVARDFPRSLQRLIGYALEGKVLGCLQIGLDPIVLLENG